MSKILVAGLGNKYLGDDGFGPKVIETLTMRDLPDNVEARDVGLCGVTLAPDLGDYELVIFVDAVEKKEGKPGTIYRTEIKAEQVVDLKPDEALRTFNLSIHETGVEELLSYAKTIGTLPPTTIFFGCEVKEIKLGDTLSRAVEAAVQKVVELIFDELQRYRERQ